MIRLCKKDNHIKYLAPNNDDEELDKIMDKQSKQHAIIEAETVAKLQKDYFSSI